MFENKKTKLPNDLTFNKRVIIANFYYSFVFMQGVMYRYWDTIKVHTNQIEKESNLKINKWY